MKKFFISFYFVLFFLSCSSKETLRYRSDYILTNEIAYAKEVNLSLNIPQGWFSALDNDNAEIILWLVKDDYSSSINFRQIHLHERIPEKNDKLQLEKVVSYNKHFVRANNNPRGKISFINDEIFYLKDNIFIAYEYMNNQGEKIRSVVFKYKGNYFESNAVTVKSEPDNLYDIQNSVLSSLK